MEMDKGGLEMIKGMVRRIFARFDWTALNGEEQGALTDGIKKHISVLKVILLFLPFQIGAAVLVQDLTMLLTVCSFLVLLLGTAWFVITFQNVSAAQLTAGVATYITLRMFRAFMLAFAILPVGTILFLIRALVPEIGFPALEVVPVAARALVAVGNGAWVALGALDVYRASVAYDAADSLLGDGFPTLMRGAKATAQNLPVLEILRSIEDLLKQQAK